MVIHCWNIFQRETFSVSGVEVDFLDDLLSVVFFVKKDNDDSSALGLSDEHFLDKIVLRFERNSLKIAQRSEQISPDKASRCDGHMRQARLFRLIKPAFVVFLIDIQFSEIPVLVVISRVNFPVMFAHFGINIPVFCLRCVNVVHIEPRQTIHDNRSIFLKDERSSD